MYRRVHVAFVKVLYLLTAVFILNPASCIILCLGWKISGSQATLLVCEG